MRPTSIAAILLASTALICNPQAFAGQAPFGVTAPDIPVSHSDRVYSADQYSNTVSVIDPADNKLLGSIHLGNASPSSLSPLYTGQLLVHGLGFSPDRRTVDVVSIGSNSVTFIDTATNSVKHISYVGRSPHEAFFTPDGTEVWVTVRGENYIQVLDGTTFEPKTRIIVANGPGMTIFSPDGKYGYVCSSFTPEIDVITLADHQIVARVPQASPFCPNIAATPDGAQVWLTLKDIGKTEVFNGRPPFQVLKILDTGPITNHVNIVRNANGTFAYVTCGGLNEVQVFRTDDFSKVATIPVGRLPHGIWPSGDGTRVYFVLENEDRVAAIDTLTNRVIATIPIGQTPQALVYVPGAVPTTATGNDAMSVMEPSAAASFGPGNPPSSDTGGLQPLGIAGQSEQFWLAPPTHGTGGEQGTRTGGEQSMSTGGEPGATAGREKAPTSLTLFDQGLVQVLEAAVTGLEPKKPYLLALATEPSGGGALEPLQSFMTNPAGAAIVNALGPIRQVVQGADQVQRRYLVIVPGTADDHGAAVQIESQ
jgi:YVTN family beta-propeller protein